MAKKKAGKKKKPKRKLALPPQTVKITSTFDGDNPPAGTFTTVSGFCRVTKPDAVVCQFGTLDEKGPGTLLAPIEAAATANPPGSLNKWTATFKFGTDLPTTGTQYVLEAYDGGKTNIKDSVVLKMT